MATISTGINITTITIHAAAECERNISQTWLIRLGPLSVGSSPEADIQLRPRPESYKRPLTRTLARHTSCPTTPTISSPLTPPLLGLGSAFQVYLRRGTSQQRRAFVISAESVFLQTSYTIDKYSYISTIDAIKTSSSTTQVSTSFDCPFATGTVLGGLVQWSPRIPDFSTISCLLTC